MREDPDRINAAIRGTHEVAVPVTFGVLTTIVAFTPLLMVEGIRGKIFAQIPMIVIPVLLFSLVESKLILPSHLSHLNFHSNKRPNLFSRIQRRIADGLEWFIENLYQPVLALALRFRYTTMALFVGVLIIVFSMVSAGHIRFIFFPRIQSEIAQARLVMPEGTPFEVTEGHIATITEAAQKLKDKHIDTETGESVIMGILSSAGTGGGSERGDHIGRVLFEIVPPEERTLAITSSELVKEWRKLIGAIPGSKELVYRAEFGRGGSPIDIQLLGSDFDRMSEVADIYKSELRNYPGVTDVTDSFEGGKQEIQMSLKPEAELLGMPIRTPDGSYVPFSSLAEASNGRGFSRIRRIDRNRTLNVTADVDKASANTEGIKADLKSLAEELATDYPDVAFSLEGEAREQRDSFGSLNTGLWFVLAVVYALLAIPFRSYLQPILVMVVIPFGVVGAILGHMLMGMNLSVQRDAFAAVKMAGVARFRPVLLTSLTTFFGLIPLIFEKSTQAQFLIPMAVSLGFGILFATFITLFLVPVNYMVLEDIKKAFRNLSNGFDRLFTSA